MIMDDCLPQGLSTRRSSEIFLGALPRETSRLKSVEAGLHAALLAHSGSSDRASVKLRMHTRTNGTGSGFAFAWLPDVEAAQRLVAVGHLDFMCDGATVRTGIRAARGRSDGRPPPANEPTPLQLNVTVVSSSDDPRVAASLDVWRRRLRRFGLGLEVQQLLAPGGDLPLLDRVHADLVVLLHRLGDLPAAKIHSWARTARELGEAGRAVLVVEGPGQPTEQVDTSGEQAPACLGLPEALAQHERAAAAGDEPISRVDVWSAAALHALYAPPSVIGTGPSGEWGGGGIGAGDGRRFASRGGWGEGGGGWGEGGGEGARLGVGDAGGGQMGGGGLRGGDPASSRGTAVPETCGAAVAATCPRVHQTAGGADGRLTLGSGGVPSREEPGHHPFEPGISGGDALNQLGSDGSAWVDLMTSLAVRRVTGCHLSSSFKVFVTDCDGTLWDGVVSEDGVDGIRFQPAHLALQASLGRSARALAGCVSRNPCQLG